MDPLQSIEKRTSALGNHLQKYLVTINRHKDNLIGDLDAAGKLMQVHLWHSSIAIGEEMRIISRLHNDAKRNVANLSCYYALQYLHMVFRHLDILALGIVSGDSQIDIYHQFLKQFGEDFRKISSAYLANLLDIYLVGKAHPDFFICSVGTRSDQDDIDLGIITADKKNVDALNQALQKVTQNMLVFATPLHLHLSEHVGEQVYTSTISEYTELLQNQIQDVVIISEVLNAQIIFGSEKLYHEFQKKVIEKYFYNTNKNIRFHEGFLRGILGEARAWLISPPQTDAISPKDDALRLLKSLLYAKKTVYNIRVLISHEIIKALMVKEPHLHSEYELMYKALSFLEMLKFLLQLYVVQEETFRPDDIDPNQLNLIAERMGYKPIGTVNSWDQLIIDYYRYVKEVRRICDFLMKDLNTHLNNCSMLIKMLKTERNKQPQKVRDRKLVLNFIDNVRFYTGTKYWEDVLNLIQNNNELLDEFIRGFDNLKEDEKEPVILRYIEWTRYTLITLFRFITIIGKHQVNEVGDILFLRMSKIFLEYIEKLPYTTERLCRIYSHYPQLIHEFLQLLPEPYFIHFDNILSQPVINDRLQEYHDQLRELCNIHKWSGQYFHRFFYRVIANHPEYLSAITQTTQLSKIASGLLAMVDVYPDYSEKKEVLGAYYDLEFLRIGIGTMRGVELSVTNREFTEFCDNYMEALYDICAEEIEREHAGALASTENFALMAAGGHARKQAYDDDYDLIALISEEDQTVIKYATKIVTRINREILNRGLFTHYRLGEILGGFVNTIDQICTYLESDSEESFIDLSQLLGARVLIGSKLMVKEINAKILEPFIFQRNQSYIERMVQEIYNREKISQEREQGTHSIKETRGGLRDIEAVALMLKAHLHDENPLSEKYFSEIKPRLHALAEPLDVLTESVYFLRTIRNLYRLMVSAEDKIQEHYLDRLGAAFAQSNHPELSTPKAIMDKIKETLQASTEARDKIIDYLVRQSN